MKQKGTYRRKVYKIYSEKVQNQLTLVLLADLHGACYGEGNCRLAEDVCREKPDLVLTAGDMVSAKKKKRRWGILPALALFENIANRTNVCYGMGNHESKMANRTELYGTAFADYKKTLKDKGVLFLSNDSIDLTLKDTKLRISGLELEKAYYKKLGASPMKEDYLTGKLGQADREAFHILLAHNPHYGRQYLNWGADLILSGHMHGGVVGFPKCGGVITPQFRLFDPYTAGRFEKQGRTLLISRGLGDHFMLPRIFNPREYLVIQLLPGKGDKPWVSK